MTDATPDVFARQRTVLLIDDDANILQGLRRVLRHAEFQILTAVSAPEGRAIVSSNEVDVIVCDNLMAGTLGTEFLSEMHEAHPDIALIMLSGYMPEAVARRMTDECGVSRVLSKPCDPEVVRAAICEVLGLSVPAPPPAFRS